MIVIVNGSPSCFGRPIGIIAAGRCGGVHIINLLAEGRRPAGMAGDYSQDLRDRVIDAVIGGKMSQRAAAARFGVSLPSAIKWVQRFERTGSRRAARMGGYSWVEDRAAVP